MRERTLAGLATTAAPAFGVVGSAARAETPPPSSSPSASPQAPKRGTPSAEQQEPSYTGSIRVPRPAGTESEADETAALAPLAKVSEADANNAARDVKVDAGNGAILAVEAGRVRRSPSAVEPPSRAG